MEQSHLIIATLAGIAVAFFGLYRVRSRVMAGSLREYAESFDGMKLHDVVVALLVLGGISLFAVTDWNSKVEGHKKTFTEQFQLPHNVEFIEFRRKARSVHGTVGFSEEQWQNYVTKLEAEPVWAPVPLGQENEKIVGVFSPNARGWNDLATLTPANGTSEANPEDLPWLHTLWHESDAGTVKNGHVLCYVYQKPGPAKAKILQSRAVTPYKVSACSDLARKERISTYVLGILDHDTKTLRMVIG